jgi:hypothetical protein
MITMGSPYFVWINAYEIISSWYLLGAGCVTPPPPTRTVRLVLDRDGTGHGVLVQRPPAVARRRRHRHLGGLAALSVCTASHPRYTRPISPLKRIGGSLDQLQRRRCGTTLVHAMWMYRLVTAESSSPRGSFCSSRR